jgi:hypothetical protein
MLRRMVISRFAVALAAAPLLAQPTSEMWPGAAYDPAIPTFRKVLGFEAGERLSSPAQVKQYFDALAAAAPARIKVFEYGRTWEKRPLIYAAISSEANIRRLEEIRASMKRLADPRKIPEAEARKLIASLPAVIMLAYSVHGNEISCTDAAMMAAYHLLASRNDKMIAGILQNAVVLIDPLQNPDGRNRFVHNYEVAEGLEPDGFTFAAERDEPWPGGRSNHYHFDMNRDWFALTQPETRARIKVLLDWYPLVFADLHEMGSESTYYFAPEAVPYNPHIAASQRASLDLFGKNNAKWFDHYGFPYFTREIFDAFFPGYGASWPIYYGSIAMTYENASVRGLLYQRNDGSLYDFKSSVQRHFVASIATAETAANNRQKLLEDFYAYRKSAIEEGQKEEIREYILPRRGDVSSVDKLAHLLAEQGIEVMQAQQAFAAGGKDFPAGSYRITAAQPMKRMIRNWLDPQVPMDKGFLAEQERRRKRKLPDEIYDVTAWSLPLQYNVECVTLNAAPPGNFTIVEPGKMPPGRIEGGKATVAYLAPWGTTASARLLLALLREGVVVRSSTKPFTQNGRAYPAGTLIVLVKQNAANIHDVMAKLVPPSGAEVIATATGWVDDGVNFGSSRVVLMKPVKIAMAWDTPVSYLSAGHTRWLLERQYGYPVTLIRTSRLGAADLSKFQVLILPNGGYAAALGSAAARLKAWVQSGGTIVGLGGGTVSFLADSKIGLLSTQAESLARPGETAPPKPAAQNDGPAPGKLLAKEEDFEKAIQAEREPPDAVAGVLVRVRVDQEHWLGAGVPESVNALVDGRTIFTPVKLDKGQNVAVFKGPDEILASGYLWEENRKQLAFKPLAIVERHGRGHVIGFTADPNFRGYMDGLNLLFLNAVFRGAAMSSGPGFGGETEERH